jgi:hypothetical protein
MRSVCYKVSIAGYNKSNILKQIILYVNIFNLKFNTFFKKSSLITMLRAPQINKSSREQFILGKYKHEFEISLFYSRVESVYSFEKYVLRCIYLFKKPSMQVSCRRLLKSRSH